MITSVDEALPMFCAGPADFPRDPVLEKPLLSPDGQHVLATDRKIVFRCAIADVTLPYADRPELCGIARLLAACIEEANLCATDGLADLPEIPPAVDCGACGGNWLYQPVKFGRASISRRFLAAIAQLPGARIAKPVTETAPVYFQSDFGDGCVMPLRD